MQWRSVGRGLDKRRIAGRGDALMLTTLVTTLALFALGLANALLVLLVIGAIADKMIEAL